MIESDNHKMMSVIWLPERYLKMKYLDFKLKVVEFLFNTDVSTMLKDDWSLLLFDYKARVVLPLLFDGIRFSESSVFINYYEKFYGKYVDKESALNVINNAISSLILRIEEIERNNKSSENRKFSLWSFIMDLELAMNLNVDKSISLVAFKQYILKSINNNSNG